MQRDEMDTLDRWYACDIPRDEIKALMKRSDLKGLIHAAAFFMVLIGLGVLAYYAIGTPWMIPAFFAYGTVYCFLNHLMHETHHRTVFKSVWLNELVHWVAGFAHGAEAIYDRWGHAQHHTYTYLIGDDPEVITPRPADIPTLVGQFFGIGIIKPGPIINHAFGIIPPADRELVPECDWKAMIWSSRLWLLGYGLIIASCFIFGTILPLVYTLFARFYGAFIPTLLNDTQHVGLEQNVYDHRRICRNVKVGPITSFLYWNMQYHTEHHMFPTVPFHALRKLNKKIKHQLPPMYPSVWHAYREIIPTILKQQTDYDYHVSPKVPDAYPTPAWDEAGTTTASETSQTETHSGKVVEEGDSEWIVVPAANELSVNDVMEFVHEGNPYSVYHLDDGFYAMSNKCSHAGAKLSRGLVIDGEIECPAHNGRFNIRTGEATLSPACENMKTFPVRIENEEVQLSLPKMKQDKAAE
jgi:fatty acid desaturase/nitrite reductase/ring-hydroxylating ferredoxin subunit